MAIALCTALCTALRVRSVPKRREICHVCWNFLPGYTCQTTAILRIMKDGSLLIHRLPSFYCFTETSVPMLS